jgi:hypothetical protein
MALVFKGDRKGHPFRGNQWRKVFAPLDWGDKWNWAKGNYKLVDEERWRAAVDQSPPQPALYRGFGLNYEEVNPFVDAHQPGTEIDIPLSSWTTDESVAETFASGSAYNTAEIQLGQPTGLVTLRLPPGVRGVPADGGLDQPG